ncbi:uncharacterized protein MONOS_2235 [Monocercomonoides exilis]|uniref:uncharacterized protein n=1 Tax=Monocercomonoides exilis TaxID=2049356 RepID=UPI0035595E1C|nr:hypothetical protein MONOS_2235 [Monocercomonoides exilis]|eukprot:MONOS_2235.1-p1 / transcript=MONOS_2235.1 / gene=MONOS_2235 / organism=Monocercomonoides_exilis_PA203 / gene_product=unspecified product / transcript_product=unspecified product / location=Mono_scaffold00045:20181-22544(+) / protein_length=788 / sequence_SO=supercontig / SO=protein_coding / is_pseudo=false
MRSFESSDVPISEVFVKQSGDEKNSGLSIGQEKSSLNSAYDKLGDSEACIIRIIKDTTALDAEVITLNKKHGITLEGMSSNGKENSIVTINCNIHPGSNIFICRDNVELNYLAFYFPSTLFKENEPIDEVFSLIYGQCSSMVIRNCKFLRPSSCESQLEFFLVYMLGDSLKMDSVECIDEKNFIKFKESPFDITAKKVELANVTLKKIETHDDYSSLCITGYESFAIDVMLNGSTFAECIESSAGALYIESENIESTFAVGDSGVTTFSSCVCSYGLKYCAGGLYLCMLDIISEDKLKWPTNGKNLVFDNCSIGKEGTKKNIGLYLELSDTSLFEAIAAKMKASFASEYTRENNLWFVVGLDEKNDMEIDFTFEFFDPPPPKPSKMAKAFVKYGGEGDGMSADTPIYSLKLAYDYLDKSGKCSIEIIKTEIPIETEEITFSISSGITIEGTNSDGSENAEAEILFDDRFAYYLLTCEKIIEFFKLEFKFIMANLSMHSFILATENSESFSMTNCRFVRAIHQSLTQLSSSSNDEDPISHHLVSAYAGKVILNSLSFVDDHNTVLFLYSPFYFYAASEVSLNGIDVNKVNVKQGSAIKIEDGEKTQSKIIVEGLNVNEVKSQNGESAGLDISLNSEASTVEIGRTRKCTFRSCSSSDGYAGAIFVGMPKAVSNLQLPAANNLDIDGSNTVGSNSISLCLISPDIEEFCQQENAFEFANDYSESAVGWIVGAKDYIDDPVNVFDIRDRAEKAQLKKKTTVIVIAIVVPVCVVFAIIIVVFIVLKKKGIC